MNAAPNPPEHDDGDKVCWGIDTRDPRTVPPGQANDAQNLRFREGVPESRKGVVKPVWANNLNVLGDQVVRPWGPITGLGLFADPNEVEWLLLAAAGVVWRTRPHNQPLSVTLPAGVTIPGKCTFVQAFGSVYLFRGRFLKPLVLTDFDTGFVDIVKVWNATDVWAAAAEAAYGPQLVVDSLTRVAETATVVTHVDHGFITGQDIVIRGADQAAYNGRFAITVVNSQTFTYMVTGAPATPATSAGGNLAASPMQNYYKAGGAGGNPGAGDSPESAPTKWTQVFNILPNADTALYCNNRLLVPTAYTPVTADYTTYTGGSYTKTDYIVATDYLDTVHFDFANGFRINQGSSDEIVDLAVLGDSPNGGTVVVWKGASWGILTNVAFDLTNLTLTMKSMEYGLSGRGAWAATGNEVHFVSGKRGVLGVQQTEFGKILSVDVPLTVSLGAYVARIAWARAAGLRLASWDSKLYCAVSLDGGSVGQLNGVNNALLVYDFQAAAKAGSNLLEKRGWCGPDTGSAICPVEYVKMHVNGVERLLFAGADGYINLVEENDGDDQVPGSNANGLGWEPVATRWLSRGYGASLDGLNRPVEGAVAMQTLAPMYSVDVVFPGVGKRTRLATDRTRDPTQYYRPWDAAPWDATNTGDNHATPDRQDYAVLLGATLNLGNNGIAVDRLQEGLETFRVNGRQGRSFQVEVRNRQGRARVLGVRLGAVSGRQRKGVQT